MMAILKTRLLHLKKQLPGVLFWLLFPSVAAIFVALALEAVQEDSKVPVGLVLEEKSEAAMNLTRTLKKTPMLRIVETTEEDARSKLAKHELDSAFIIQDGYAEEIKKGSRHQLITSYKSDLSLAYTPVKEMLLSYVQEETGRSKAAHIVRQLSKAYSGGEQWSWEEITKESKQIQKEANLLRTDFSFLDEGGEKTDSSTFLLNIWDLWALFAVLSVLLLSDWIIREKNAAASMRFLFLKFSFTRYLLFNALLYTCLFFLFDLLAAGLFYFIFQEAISLSFLPVLLSYRVMISAGAFLLALVFNRIFLYYCVAFMLTLIISVTSGLSAANSTEMLAIHPLYAFSSGETDVLWPAIFILLITVWFWRKERSDA